MYEQVNALQRWLADRSLTGVELGGDERLLDVGCGDGHVTAELARRLPHGSVLGIDPSPGMVDAARQRATDDDRLRFEAGDVLAMNFVAEFDVVVSFNVLHWVADQGAALARIHAALRPNGWALLQFVCGGPRPSLEATAMEVGNRARWREAFAGFPPPFVHADPDRVREEVEAAGFAVTELTVDDLSWEFDSPADFRRWSRAGFSAWTSRLADEDTATAFVDEVVRAYSRHTGSAKLFRFLQLRAVLSRRPAPGKLTPPG